VRLVARIGVVIALTVGSLGCGGHSEQEWLQLQHDLDVTKAALAEAMRREAEDAKRYADAEQRLQELVERVAELSAPRSTMDLSGDPPPPPPDAHPPGAPTLATPDSPSNIYAPTDRTSPSGNGLGPTPCADGTVSGSAGRGTCSHHGGEAGTHHRKR
jgi:hypothetical protein